MAADSTYIGSTAMHACDSTVTPDIATAAAASVLPADSAFTGGKLLIQETSRPATVPGGQDADLNGRTAADTVLVLMAIVFIIFMKGILTVMPMVIGSLFRWKENLNIEDSMKMCRERDRFALILFPAFCVTISRYGVWPVPYAGSRGLLAAMGITAAALIAFLLLRALLIRIMRPSGMNPKVWKAANNAFRTYFIIAAILAMATAGIMSACGCGDMSVRMAIIYESAALWLVFLLRKMQIFKNSCSLFSAILYLCTLEILPMALLTAVPAMFP